MKIDAVADRCEASFLQIVFEDDGEVLFYGTGRNKVPAWALRQVTPGDQTPSR